MSDSTRKFDFDFAKRKGVAPYVFTILIAMVLGAFGTWVYGIAGMKDCNPAGYDGGFYLAYCKTKSPLSYEHARVWFGTDLDRGLGSADVIFTGPSTTEIAFKNSNVADFFHRHGASFYLLAFTYGETALFAMDVIKKFDLRPAVVVVNSDHAFLPPTQLARYVMDGGPIVRAQFSFASEAQSLQRGACASGSRLFTFICSGLSGLFRSPETGQWRSFQAETEHLPIQTRPVEASEQSLASLVANARQMKKELEEHNSCMVLVTTPRDFVNYGEALSISRAAGIELLSVNTDNLRTYDGTHLDKASAVKWSNAILQKLDPVIARCRRRAVRPRS